MVVQDSFLSHDCRHQAGSPHESRQVVCRQFQLVWQEVRVLTEPLLLAHDQVDHERVVAACVDDVGWSYVVSSLDRTLVVLDIFNKS